MVPKYDCERKEAGSFNFIDFPRLLGTSSEMLSHQSGIDQDRSSAVSACGDPEHRQL